MTKKKLTPAEQWKNVQPGPGPKIVPKDAAANDTSLKTARETPNKDASNRQQKSKMQQSGNSASKIWGDLKKAADQQDLKTMSSSTLPIGSPVGASASQAFVANRESVKTALSAKSPVTTTNSDVSPMTKKKLTPAEERKHISLLSEMLYDLVDAAEEFELDEKVVEASIKAFIDSGDNLGLIALDDKTEGLLHALIGHLHGKGKKIDGNVYEKEALDMYVDDPHKYAKNSVELQFRLFGELSTGVNAPFVGISVNKDQNPRLFFINNGVKTLGNSYFLVVALKKKLVRTVSGEKCVIVKTLYTARDLSTIKMSATIDKLIMVTPPRSPKKPQPSSVRTAKSPIVQIQTGSSTSSRSPVVTSKLTYYDCWVENKRKPRTAPTDPNKKTTEDAKKEEEKKDEKKPEEKKVEESKNPQVDSDSSKKKPDNGDIKKNDKKMDESSKKKTNNDDVRKKVDESSKKEANIDGAKNNNKKVDESSKKKPDNGDAKNDKKKIDESSKKKADNDDAKKKEQYVKSTDLNISIENESDKEKEQKKDKTSKESKKSEKKQSKNEKETSKELKTTQEIDSKVEPSVKTKTEKNDGVEGAEGKEAKDEKKEIDKDLVMDSQAQKDEK
uniref:Uncharacterized protein n=1 Tax=Panagrolaimus sp. JU765 TaxID=591449 RepID=A0AC34Q7K1_9BILA